jgi:hypothetical protein
MCLFIDIDSYPAILRQNSDTARAEGQAAA